MSNVCCVIRCILKGKDKLDQIERISLFFNDKNDANEWRKKYLKNNPENNEGKLSTTVSWNPEHLKLPITLNAKHSSQIGVTAKN